MRTLALVVAVASCAACSMQGKWTYPMDSAALYRSGGTKAPLTIAVLPFREDRGTENNNWMPLSYIPLVPFSTSTYERPEAALMFVSVREWEFQVDEDLGKAAARSLSDSGLVERAFFTFGADVDEADYTLAGTVRRSEYRGTLITYGLSAYGSLLWLLGLPAGISRNALEIDFALVDPSSERTVWTFRWTGDSSLTQGMYYQLGEDMAEMPRLMQDGMNAALQDLAKQLPPQRLNRPR